MENSILNGFDSSASKIVLILFSLALVAGLFTGHVQEDTFKIGLVMVLTFYFSHKGDQTKPYGGK